jgi:hypothetical protein
LNPRGLRWWFAKKAASISVYLESLVSNELKKGARVRHPSVAEWGLGLVLEDSDGDHVRVFFTEVGEKKMSLKVVQPIVVTGEAAQSAILDNLKIEGGRVAVKYKSLSSSIDYFRREFPGGFFGDRYACHERDHKDAIREEIQTALSREKMCSLLDAGEHRAICDLAIRLTGVQANAMIFKSEKISLRDGLKSDESCHLFAKTLYAVLHGDDEFDARFDAFADALQVVGAAKWTVATYFLFFMHPDVHMFVKPTITQNAAGVCAFDINYKPRVNARTYRSVLAFSRYLRDEIGDLKPRDMIDVQSFMWCIAPGTYGPNDV